MKTKMKNKSKFQQQTSYNPLKPLKQSIIEQDKIFKINETINIKHV